MIIVINKINSDSDIMIVEDGDANKTLEEEKEGEQYFHILISLSYHLILVSPNELIGSSEIEIMSAI